MSRKKKNKPVMQDGMNYRVFNNQVVEATLTGPSTQNSFNKYLSGIVGPWGGKYIRGVFGNNMGTYIGRAFCNVDMGEEFDLEVGKKLATERCLEAYHDDFDKHIVEFLEELHTIEARLFNRLRKAGKLDVYNQALGVDEIYDKSFRMPDQPSYLDVYMDSCPDFFSFIPSGCEDCDECSECENNGWAEK